MSKIDLPSGSKFSKLTVLSKDHTNKSGRVKWLCQCDCGKFKLVSTSHLIRGTIKSCGCARVETALKRNSKGGVSSHPLYGRWSCMVQRCCNPTSAGYVKYGGRGIKVCEEWLESKNYINYVTTLYPNWEYLCDLGFQVDRIDNDGNYEPGNIRLVSPSVNSKNKSSNPEKNRTLSDCTGLRFGKLMALKIVSSFGKRKRWLCLCDCGNTCEVTSICLTNGNTKSCGCLRKENNTQRKHSLRSHKLYSVWARFRSICYHPWHRSYKNYGALGVTICESWKGNFREFYDWAIKIGWEEGMKVRTIPSLTVIGPETCYLSSNMLGINKVKKTKRNPTKIR